MLGEHFFLITGTINKALYISCKGITWRLEIEIQEKEGKIKVYEKDN